MPVNLNKIQQDIAHEFQQAILADGDIPHIESLLFHVLGVADRMFGFDEGCLIYDANGIRNNAVAEKIISNWVRYMHNTEGITTMMRYIMQSNIFKELMSENGLRFLLQCFKEQQRQRQGDLFYMYLAPANTNGKRFQQMLHNNKAIAWLGQVFADPDRLRYSGYELMEVLLTLIEHCLVGYQSGSNNRMVRLVAVESLTSLEPEIMLELPAEYIKIVMRRIIINLNLLTRNDYQQGYDKASRLKDDLALFEAKFSLSAQLASLDSNIPSSKDFNTYQTFVAELDAYVLSQKPIQEQQEARALTTMSPQKNSGASQVKYDEDQVRAYRMLLRGGSQSGRQDEDEVTAGHSAQNDNTNNNNNQSGDTQYDFLESFVGAMSSTYYYGPNDYRPFF